MGQIPGEGFDKLLKYFCAELRETFLTFFANLIIEIVESLSFFGWHAPPLSLLHSPESGM